MKTSPPDSRFRFTGDADGDLSGPEEQSDSPPAISVTSMATVTPTGLISGVILEAVWATVSGPAASAHVYINANNVAGISSDWIGNGVQGNLSDLIQCRPILADQSGQSFLVDFNAYTTAGLNTVSTILRVWKSSLASTPFDLRVKVYEGGTMVESGSHGYANSGGTLISDTTLSITSSNPTNDTTLGRIAFVSGSTGVVNVTKI